MRTRHLKQCARPAGITTSSELRRGQAMRITSSLAMAAMLLTAGHAAAQDQRPVVVGDTAAVVYAALEWFASPEHLGSDVRTLVVSGLSNGWTSLRPGAVRTAQQTRGEPRAIELPPGILRRLEAKSGLPVRVCNELDHATKSLCGYDAPWRWYVYDLPSVERDRARMTMMVMWLESRTTHFADYELELTKERGAWTVTAATPAGVS